MAQLLTFPTGAPARDAPPARDTFHRKCDRLKQIDPVAFAAIESYVDDLLALVPERPAAPRAYCARADPPENLKRVERNGVRTMRRLTFGVLACVFLTACSGNDKAPTGPTPPPASQTLRSVQLSGAFTGWKKRGDTFQTTATGTFADGSTQNVTSSCNSWGNDNPNVMSISQTGLITVQGDGVSAVWTTCQSVYTTGRVTLTVIPDQTFFRSGVGDNVFDIPTYVTRVRIQGSYPGRCENFIASVAGRTLVNVILGTCSVADALTHDGTYAITAGGQAEIRSSPGVNWTFTEVR